MFDLDRLAAFDAAFETARARHDAGDDAPPRAATVLRPAELQRGCPETGAREGGCSFREGPGA